MTDTEARAADDATPDEHHDQPPLEDAGEPHDEGPQPSWWHRSHPTFAGVVGFFSGVAYVIVVPGVYAALLGLFVSDTMAAKLFPWVLAALVVPLAMLVSRKTRRFAQFAFLGIVSTAVVVALTAGITLWVMVKLDH
jgi:hypothetical protein